MAKDANNVFKKRSNSSKPYDVSNSFVKQVANRVSNLIPQTSWLNRWMTPTTPSDVDANFLPNQVSEDNDDAGTEQPPPLKRPRIPLNQSFSADNFLISRTSNRNECVEANSKASVSCFQDDREEAGPSGLSGLPRSRLVSSTPDTQSHAIPSSSRTAQITPIANGDDRSDSGESTSGCSSLVPQGTRQPYSNETANFSTGTVRRASVDEKDFSSYLQNSRIFPNRISTSVSVNSSPNPRQGPSFNSSLYTLPFATRSPSLDRSFSSPFYSGPTVYGGASASRKRRSGFFSPSEVLPVTQSIQVKPVNRSNSSELSSVTARRILDTLDELSSPVRDAKRVPLTTPTSRKRRAEEGTPGPPIGDLTIPNVPDLLRLHRRMKLQDSLESARIIASSPAATQSPVSSEYRLQLQQDASRHTNKMTARRRDLEEDFQQDVHLPNIALPITSLPKFDFMTKQTPKRGFNLGRALDLSLLNDNNPPSLSNVSDAKLDKSSSEISTLNRIPVTQPPVISNVNFIPSWPSMVHSLSPPTRLKEKPKLVEGNGPIERSSFGIGVAGELKTGSVMDILGKKDTSLSSKPFESTFKPPTTWECNACLVRNKAEVSQCMSCKTPRSLAKAPASSANVSTTSLQPTVATSKAPAVASGFGTQFKPAVNTWKCKDCYLENKHEVTMCVACRAVKPKPKEVATAAGFGTKFLPASDTWECVTCMVRNKATSEFCAACEGIKPGSGNNLPVLSKPVSGFGNMFKKPAGSWECPDCMVVNKEISKCVACGASKPTMGDDSTNNNSTAIKSASGDLFKLPEGSWECPDCMLVNKDVWKCVACEATKPGIPGFGDMFKKPEGSWECTSCMVSNKNGTKCVACETPKPGVAGFGDKFKKPEGSWECPDCMLSNKNVDKCVACEAPKPGVAGFGDKFKKPEGSWECPDCMLSNKNVEKCVACEAPKPGTVKATQPIPTIKFNFDIPPEASSFKFGVDKAGDTINTDVNAANKVAKPADVGSFKFGATLSTGDTAGFTFGNPDAKNTSNSNVSTGFSFGNGGTVSKTSKPETSLPSAALFTFGIPATEKKTQCNENGKIESIPPASNAIDVKKSVDSVQLNNVKAQATFSFNPIKSDGPQKLEGTAPSFKFGAPTSDSSNVGPSNVKLNGPTTFNPLTTTSNSSPSFGGLATNALPTSSSSQSLFGTSNPSPLFSGFSTTTTSSFDQAATTTPSFGQTATKTPSFGQTATTTPSFGQTAIVTPSFGQSTTATPSFGQTTTTPLSASSFGTMGKSTPAFNFVSPTTATVGQKRSCNDDDDRLPAGKKQASSFPSMPGSNSGNVFGSVATNSTSTSAPVMSFGSSTKPSEISFKSSVNPSFGSSFSSGSADGTGSGLTSDKPVASTTPFVFGASVGSSSGPPPAYSFSAKPETSVPAPTSTFGFRAATPVTGGFNFSRNTNEKPAGGFSFGSAPTTFGNATAVAPVFGGGPAAQPPAYPSASAGFNFGGSVQQVPTTSVFSFSANTTAPTFAFGQGATPAPTFDPNARPTFNFTGGDIPQFTAAGASVQSSQTRRIKKAVRRAPPR